MRKIVFWLSLAVIFMIPWETVVEYPMGSVARLGGIALAFLWMVTIVLTGQVRRPNSFHYIAFLYVLWNAISVFWSRDTSRTLDRVTTFAQLLLLTFILWDLLTSRAALLAGLQAYILGAYVTLGSTIVNFLSGQTFYYDRFSATGTNPDDFGAVLVLGIPVAWFLVASTANHKHKMHPLMNLVNYVYIPLALGGIALSGTRTALIALVPGILFVVFSLSRLRFSTQIAIGLFFVSAAFLLIPRIPPTSFQRFETINTELAEGDLSGRRQIWQDGLLSFAEHPFIGVGSNMFRSVTSVINLSGQGKVAHNSFLSVLVEVGLIGFTLFATMIVITVFQAFRQPKLDSIFWLSVLAIWFITAFTLTWEYMKPTWLFLSLVIINANLPIKDDISVVDVKTRMLQGISTR